MYTEITSKENNQFNFHSVNHYQTFSKFQPKQIEQSQNLSGHWSSKQKAKYIAFLEKFKDKFNQKESRRQWKVFKALSEFIKTRTANQCRSHHHKMNKNFTSVEDALQLMKKRNPFLESKSLKYSEQLSKIEFKNIQQSQFSKIFRIIRRPIRKNNGLDNKNLQKYQKAEERYLGKPYDLSNIPTDLNYFNYNEPQVNKLAFYNSINYPTTNILAQQNKPLQIRPISKNQCQELMVLKEKLVLQCQEYFQKWLQKINSLIN